MVSMRLYDPIYCGWSCILRCIAIVDTLTDTLTVQNGPGITDAREQFELGYPLPGALEPNSRGSVISNIQHSMPLP